MGGWFSSTYPYMHTLRSSVSRNKWLLCPLSEYSLPRALCVLLKLSLGRNASQKILQMRDSGDNPIPWQCPTVRQAKSEDVFNKLRVKPLGRAVVKGGWERSSRWHPLTAEFREGRAWKPKSWQWNPLMSPPTPRTSKRMPSWGGAWGGVSHLVKSPPHPHKDLNSDSQTPHKSPAHICNLSTADAERQGPGVH